MLAKRIAIVFATIGAMSCIYGGMFVSVLLVKARTTAAYWAVLPFALCLGVFIQILRDAGPVAVWLPLGGLVGFVVSALLSLGAGFFLGSVMFLIAASIQLFSRATPKFWDACVAFLLGASGIDLMFFVRDLIRIRMLGIEGDHAPIVVAGSWLFIAMLAIAWMTYWLRAANEIRR